MKIAASLVALALAAGCSGGGGGGGKDVVTTGQIGPAGGQLATVSGISVEFPARAVDQVLDVVITETKDKAPSGFGAISRRVRFEPADIVFARPVTVRFPLPDGADAADVSWTRLDGAEGRNDLAGTATGGTLTTHVVHFGEAFLATPGDTRTVVGSSVTTIVSGAAIRNVPDDLTGFEFRAFGGSTGGGVVGSGFANGTFTIPGVPPGEYRLQADRTFLVTTAGAIDLGAERIAREDVVELADPSSAQIHLQLTGMAPWNATDVLELWAPGADVFSFGLQAVSPPAVGSTTLDLTFSATEFETATNAIEGTKGDQLWIGQLATTSTGGFPYRSMQRIFEAEPFDLFDAETETLTGSFTDVTAGNTEAFDLRGSTFWTHRADVTPDSPPQLFPQLVVVGQPGGTSFGPIGASVDYVLFTSADDTDVLLPDVTWGEPTGSFGTAVLAGTFTTKSYRMPTTSTGPADTGSLVLQTTLADAVAGPIVLRLSPVQNPTINGAGLFANNTGVGLTPTITWDAPAIGVPTRYAVRLRSLRVDPGDTSRTVGSTVGTFFTTDTSLTIPPGVLEIGGTYAVRIRATDAPFGPSAPNRTAYPVSIADTLSGLFSPASRLFVSTTQSNGNLGGLAGADAACTTLAQNGGLTGSWKAWLSNASTDAIDRIEGSGPWHLLDGRRAFVDRAALQAGPSAQLLVSEIGSFVFPSSVWTGTGPGGTFSGNGCDNWTNGASGIGTVGSAFATTSLWTENATDACASANSHLYCFGP